MDIKLGDCEWCRKLGHCCVQCAIALQQKGIENCAGLGHPKTSPGGLCYCMEKTGVKQG